MGVWYATREALKASLGIKVTARDNALVDSSLESASRDVESQLNRVFWPWLGTRYADWPNYASALAWELWLDLYEVISITTLTSGGTVIPAADYNLEPNSSGPPYNLIELKRDHGSAWSVGTASPQRSVAITGLFGYRDDTSPAGTLVGGISASVITLVVSDSSLTGTGDLLLVGTERMLVTNRRTVTTGDTAQAGLTASNADDGLHVTSGAAWGIGEIVVVGTERMLVVDVNGNVLTVKRAYDGTVLAAHSTGDVIYAERQLTVARGYAGTTAASHLNGDAVAKSAWPGMVAELTLAEAENNYIQKTSGYARVLPGDGNASARPVPGASLPDLRKRAYATAGRQMRLDAV